LELTKTIVEQAIENLDKMNKIFTLKSPLYIKYPNGETRVIEEIFQHPISFFRTLIS
jgi:hypothetical protein